MHLSQSCSDAALAAAAAEANALGVAMNVAVVDAGANLKAFLRMDRALIGSIDVALKKARTSALFGMRTEEVGEFCKPGGTSPGLDSTNGGLVVFAGGVPLLGSGGDLCGAVGVSGGSVAQDSRVAAAASAAARSIVEKEEVTWHIAQRPGQEQPAPLPPHS